MPRTHARILTAIWRDRDFLALTEAAQRMYELALTQPGLTACGVVSYTPKRWAKFAKDSTARRVAAAVAELERSPSRFVVVDLDTEELLVRTFAKNDGILRQPNMVTAMWRAAAEIVSRVVLEGFADGLPEGFREGFAEAFPEGIPEALLEVFGEPLSRAHAQDTRARPPSPSPTPSPSSSSHGASPNGSGSVVVIEEEDRLIRAEAERRLATRKPSLEPIKDRERWIRTTMTSIREERRAERVTLVENARLWGVTLARTGVVGAELVARIRDHYGEDRELRAAALRSAREVRRKLVAA